MNEEIEAGATSYDIVQRGLHWLMAVLIISAMSLGIWIAFFAARNRDALLFWHKSFGSTVLVLIGVPASVGDHLRVQSAGGAIYLRESDPIRPTWL